jgi:cob(I)alamin adenosyltransferase
MSSPPLNDSSRAVNPVYSRRGDGGETTLRGGQRVAKNSVRIEAYGAVEELNAFVGSARSLAEALTDRNGRVWPLVPFLLRIQHELFNLGASLDSPADADPLRTSIAVNCITRLEDEIDRIDRDLPVVHSLVLPGSGPLNSALHQCRAFCRRAERATVTLASVEPVPPEILQYLNRLSDAFFVWSRWASHVSSEDETLWDPHHS